ncbi:MAG: hypoxanthine phosphoribosyltransferase [Dehalococcoidales bacterium]|nr:hypoxanthine phosphoribosyltransferase [Dehalococcoidales bacterium]
MSSQAGLKVLVSRAELKSTVDKLAADITRDYHDKNPLLLGILKGVFVFMSDLVRRLDFPLEIEFVRLSSYSSGRETSGNVKMVQGLEMDIKDRHVLVVEDIIDTGTSLASLLDYLKKKKPASLKLCALTDKPSRRRIPLKIDYLGLTVPDKFLVGYGLDCDQKYRNLPDICVLEE